MQTLKLLEDVMRQKEQALIQYINCIGKPKTVRILTQRLFADLAKAEEKHITVIRDQVANFSKSTNLDKYQSINQYTSQHFDETTQ